MTNRHRTKAAGLPLALPGAEAGAPGVDAQALAERVAAGMFAGDRASRALGMRIESVAPGHAAMTMTVRDDMLNGHAICHGGFITTLADSAFAFACNSRGDVTVAAGLDVELLAAARKGDVLTARAFEVASTGRTGVYDITVTNQRGETVALVRGRAHRLKDQRVLGSAGAAA